MCGCITKIDADLKPDGQSLNATIFGERRALISLIRSDKWTAETRRSKPKFVLAKFCPFCGEAYPETAVPASLEAVA